MKVVPGNYFLESEANSITIFPGTVTLVSLSLMLNADSLNELYTK